MPLELAEQIVIQIWPKEPIAAALSVQVEEVVLTPDSCVTAFRTPFAMGEMVMVAANVGMLACAPGPPTSWAIGLAG